jgi:lipoprotein-releasing system permease protein
MYKLLLCWRYLRTRYIALVSVISVMLGVATLIVVNSVMEGFSFEMQNRIHGILSDVVLDVRNFSGAPDVEGHIKRIQQIAGDEIEAMTPTVATPAMLQIQFNGQEINKPIRMLVGIDEKTQGKVSDFSRYLQHPANRRQMSWRLRESGYDMCDPQGGASAPERPQMAEAGWKYRRDQAALKQNFREGFFRRSTPTAPQKPEAGTPHSEISPQSSSTSPHPNPLPKGEGTKTEPLPTGEGTKKELLPKGEGTKTEPLPTGEGTKSDSQPTGEGRKESPSPEEPAPEWPMLPPDSALAVASAPKSAPAASSGGTAASMEDPLKNYQSEKPFDMAKDQNTGIVIGMATVSFRRLKDQGKPAGGTEDMLLVRPGDDVMIWVPTVGNPPRFIYEKCTVVDLYESKMSEYDETFVFVPISRLQELRGMFGKFNQIQIKLRPGADGEAVRDKLRAEFPAEFYTIETWRDKQGPLLQAVELESTILNILLFLIIAVAGFGILAIFFMIVVEKTRDIGILKSLGASSQGVMSIFLTYGLLLGAVGSGVGLILGLLFVHYINEIAGLMAWIMGRPVFDPTIYYFSSIPTIVEPLTLAWIVVGAMGIAVAASILPARRAARLHPVEALRYE